MYKKIQVQKMDLTHFSKTINMPVAQYFMNIRFDKENKEKDRVWFLSGDPTAYDNTTLKLPQAGYDILRASIDKATNHGYTLSSGEPSAKKAVAEFYNRMSKFPIQPNDVIIHHGVNHGLISALIAFTNPGDEILIPETGYPIFTDTAPSMKIKPVSYPLLPNQNYQIDLDKTQELLTEKTKFMFIVNPTNPMGTVYTKKHMEEIINFADKNQIPLVIDEVYYRQVFPGVEYTSFAELVENIPAIILCGVEKVLGVPGWSTSWTVLFDKHNYLDEVRHNLAVASTIFLHSNKFTQISLPELLELEKTFTTDRFISVKENHDWLFNELETIKGWRPVQAQGTIYLSVLVDIELFKDIDSDTQLADKLLQEENINAIPLTVFGGGRNGLRLITCGTKQLYEKFIDRVKSFTERHQ